MEISLNPNYCSPGKHRISLPWFSVLEILKVWFVRSLQKFCNINTIFLILIPKYRAFFNCVDIHIDGTKTIRAKLQGLWYETRQQKVRLVIVFFTTMHLQFKKPVSLNNVLKEATKFINCIETWHLIVSDETGVHIKYCIVKHGSCLKEKHLCNY